MKKIYKIALAILLSGSVVSGNHVNAEDIEDITVFTEEEGQQENTEENETTDPGDNEGENEGNQEETNPPGDEGGENEGGEGEQGGNGENEGNQEETNPPGDEDVTPPGGNEGNQENNGNEDEDYGSDNEDNYEPEYTPPTQENVKSSEARLYSLYVGSNTLKPEFSSDVYEYSVEVEHDVEEVKIEANPWSSKASVSGAGTKKLVVGHNNFSIVVKAEDGTTLTYKIDVLRKENPNIYVEYKGKKLGILNEYPATDVPKGFKKGTIKIQDKEATCLQNKNGTITIIYLQDEQTQEASFYYYSVEENKVLYKFASIDIDNTTYYIVEIPTANRTMQGAKLAMTTINRQDIEAWTFTNNKGYETDFVLYLLSSDGSAGYYLYDKDTDKVLKIPETTVKSADAIKEWVESQKKESPIMKYGIYGGIAVGVVAILAFVLKLFKKGKKTEEDDDMDSFVVEQKASTSTIEQKSTQQKQADVDDFVESVFGAATITPVNNEVKNDTKEDDLVDFTFDIFGDEKKQETVEDSEEDDWIDSNILNTVLKDDDE